MLLCSNFHRRRAALSRRPALAYLQINSVIHSLYCADRVVVSNWRLASILSSYRAKQIVSAQGDIVAMSQEPEDKNDQNQGANYMGGGIALGVAIGVVLGMLLENLGMGIAIGVGIGTAIGAGRMASQRKDNGQP
jgi:uncharacterized membrane protein